MLRDVWQGLSRKRWFIRSLVAVAAVTSGLEVVFAVFADDPPLPRGLFAALSGLTTVAAFILRYLAQKDFPE